MIDLLRALFCVICTLFAFLLCYLIFGEFYSTTMKTLFTVFVLFMAFSFSVLWIFIEFITKKLETCLEKITSLEDEIKSLQQR